MMITQTRLRALLSYNKETGEFCRLVTTGSRGLAGSVAGGISNGYVSISLDGRPYYAHRLVWLWLYGRWPCDEVDHINGVKTDNRFCNLREVTRALNHRNMRRHKDNLSGVKGVTWRSDTSRWMAQICVNGRNRSLGSFTTKQEAADAYAKAASALHGPFARLD